MDPVLFLADPDRIQILSYYSISINGLQMALYIYLFYILLRHTQYITESIGIAVL